MRPESNDAEEGEVDGDAVEEGATHGRRADTRRIRVCREFAAGFYLGRVFTAVWCDVRVRRWEVAVRLWSESCVLRGYHHGDGVVDCEDDEGE